MYHPHHFAAPGADAVTNLVRQHPLGTLITLDAAGEPIADEIPFLHISRPGQGDLLLGHVARANPLWHAHPPERPVLVVFKGVDAYISPNWYPSKAEHGRAVPTWNYTVVQARGRLTLLEPGSAALRDLLCQLTAEHEAHQAHPWTLDDAPSDYTASLLRAVVGLRVEVQHWQGKWKTSQNQSAANRDGVAAGLRSQPCAAHETMAVWVAQGGSSVPP